MDLAHPLRVTLGQVVVHGHHVHASLAQPVQVHRQGRDQGLALARLHLRDPPEVQGGAAHQLDVVVALADDPVGGLAHGRERLEQQVVDVLAPGQALTELDRPVTEGVVAQRLHLGLERVDVGHQRLQGPLLLALTRPEDAGKDRHAGQCTGGVSRSCSVP